MLAAVLYLALLAARRCSARSSLRTPASGRALLREVRSSFYRKLFLAFWAGAVVPVFILAISTRTYFATQLRAGAEEAAARTVTTAQRLVEDYAALQQRGAAALDAIDDQIMVLVRRAIDEDVNLFDRAHLQATSARDLFASQLLPTRTPGDVYRAILLDRLPTYVGDETGRRLRVPARGGAGAGRRPRRHRHRAADQPAAGDRAADRRARSPRALRASCCSACSARRWDVRHVRGHVLERQTSCSSSCSAVSAVIATGTSCRFSSRRRAVTVTCSIVRPRCRRRQPRPAPTLVGCTPRRRRGRGGWRRGKHDWTWRDPLDVRRRTWPEHLFIS